MGGRNPDRRPYQSRLTIQRSSPTIPMLHANGEPMRVARGRERDFGRAAIGWDVAGELAVEAEELGDDAIGDRLAPAVAGFGAGGQFDDDVEAGIPAGILADLEDE